MKKTVGILGGMGPLATADLFQKIILNTPAACDQDHLHVLIDSNTNIPDRTRALLDGGESPLPEMTGSAKRLYEAGADFLIMPCNTAHGFYDAVQATVPIPVLHMIRLTKEALLRQNVRCAALLATDGTIQTGIYQRELDGITLLTPNKDEQRSVMALIYEGVKAGNRSLDAAPVQQAADRLLQEGAQTVILGCTELPLAMSLYNLRFPATDPTLELALGAIAFAGK